jgi:hypothetical protein
VVLTPKDSTLAAEFMGRPSTPMARKTDSSFTFPVGNIELAFPLNPGGPAKELVMITPTATDRVPRLPDAPVLSPAELGAYAGKYWSDELQVSYTLEVTGGKLYMRRPGSGQIELKPFAPEMFSANVGKLSFRRTDGKVSGFKLGTSRSEGIEFVRGEK